MTKDECLEMPLKSYYDKLTIDPALAKKLKPVELHRGKLHAFLGMELNFSEPRKCKIKQFCHVDKLLEEWPEKLEPKQTFYD